MSPAHIQGVVSVAAALLGLGCSVPLETSPLPGQVNTCSASSTCGAGAKCAQGVCVATAFDLTGLILEVRPHSNASFGATTSYAFDLADTSVELLGHGPSDRPFFTHLDLPLPGAFSVVGGRVRVNHETLLEPSCNLGADRAIPAHLDFYRVAKYAGLPFDPVPAIAAPNGTSITFGVDLVPATYDVYVMPQPVAGCHKGNAYPPAFLPNQQIGTGGSLSWELPELPVMGHLTGTITGFGKDAPGAWKIELLEPGLGLPISANGALTPTTGGFTIAADIAWQAAPILRLAPSLQPSDPPQATVYWALDGSLFGGSQTNPVVAFTVDQLYAKPVKVSGQIRGTDDFTGVAASITIQSTKLYGPDAENAAITVPSFDTDVLGNFVVYLPPGKYQLRAFPLDGGLEASDHPLTVPANAACFCGQHFALTKKLSLAGAVRTPTGERLAGAAVEVTPAQTLPSSFWLNAHALAPLTARPWTTTTDGAGKFTLRVDSGSSDLTIQPAAGSSFPWLVRSQPTAPTDAQLASLTLTSPAILNGAVTDPSRQPVADAEVNAWLPVRGGMPGTVVKIGTTSTDASGGYTLILPSSI